MRKGIRKTTFGQLSTLAFILILLAFTIYGFTVTARKADYKGLQKSPGTDIKDAQHIADVTVRKFARLWKQFDCHHSEPNGATCKSSEGNAYLNDLLSPVTPVEYINQCKKLESNSTLLVAAFCPVSYGIMARAFEYKRQLENIILINMLFIILQISLFIAYHKMLKSGHASPPEGDKLGELFPQ